MHAYRRCEILSNNSVVKNSFFSFFNLDIFKNATLSILFFVSAYLISFFRPVDKFIASVSLY